MFLPNKSNQETKSLNPILLIKHSCQMFYLLHSCPNKIQSKQDSHMTYKSYICPFTLWWSIERNHCEITRMHWWLINYHHRMQGIQSVHNYTWTRKPMLIQMNRLKGRLALKPAFNFMFYLNMKYLHSSVININNWTSVCLSSHFCVFTLENLHFYCLLKDWVMYW